MTQIWSELTASLYFGILLSVGAFQIGRFIANKTKIAVLNPLAVSMVLVIVFLWLTGVPYESYNRGASVLTLLLGPATVSLAIPLHRQFTLLHKNIAMVLIGVGAGAVSAVLGVFGLSFLFRLTPEVYRSILTKSITLPIALGVTQELSGIPVLTILAITLTGISGAAVGPTLCRLFRIRDRIAIGLALGTCSHAVGTSRALEIGELEGAMGGLSIVVAGLVTVVIAPIAAAWL